MDSIPDATTVAFSRERLRKAGVIEELFEMFEKYLCYQNLLAYDEKNINTTLVPDQGKKNSFCINIDHCIIRCYAVPPANVHDSQMLPHLFDPENEHDYVWADFAYLGECFGCLLSLGGFESLIPEISNQSMC